MRKTPLLALTLLQFTFWLPAGAQAAPILLDRLEASVNSDLILFSDIRQFRKTEKLRGQLDPLYSGTAIAAKGDNARDSEITEFLIDERLISQQFPVGDPEVEQEINSIQATNRIERETLKKALTQQGFTFEDYFELIRTSAAKRNLIDREIRMKVAITDNDIKNYFYNKLTNQQGAVRSFQLKIIHISPKSYKTLQAAIEASQRAIHAIREGETFEEVAKRFSDHPSASSGGDLGTLTEPEMSPEIREQVKKLQIGQVSDVFGNSSSGFYILKLIDVQSGESAQLEKIKEEIRNHLLAAEYQHQIALWLERQRQNAFIHRAGEPSTAGIGSGPAGTGP